MKAFPAPLRVELLDDRKSWRLLESFVFLDPEVGPIVVPAGFVTDYASVPRLPLTYTLFGPYGHAAAVIHDYLYATGLYPREVADRVFHRALRASGIARWRAGLMYAGVRVGGAGRYTSAPA